MSFSFVATSFTSNDPNSSATSNTITFPQAIQVGDLLMIIANTGGTASAPPTISTLTDSIGTLYVLAASDATHTFSGVQIAQWMYIGIAPKAASANTNVATANYSAASTTRLLSTGAFRGFTGMPIITTAATTSGTGTALTAPAVGVTPNNCIQVAFFAVGSSISAAGSGSTTPGNDVDGNAYEYQFPSAASSLAQTATQASSAAWAAIAATFTAQAGLLAGPPTEIARPREGQGAFALLGAGGIVAAQAGILLQSRPTEMMRADPGQIVFGGKLPASGAPLVMASPEMLRPRDAQGVFPQAGAGNIAAPATGALLTMARTDAPPSVPGSLLLGGALPQSGGLAIGAPPDMAPGGPPMLLKGSALLASGVMLQGPATGPPPSVPGSILTAPQPAATAPTPPLVARTTESPPTVPGSLLVGSPLPPPGSLLVARTTDALPTLPGSILSGGKLPASATALVMAPTVAPQTYPLPTLVFGFSPPVLASAYVLIPQPTDALPTLPGGLLRGSALPLTGALLSGPTTISPPTVAGTIVAAPFVPPAPGALLAMVPTTSPPTVPGGMAVGSALPLSGAFLTAPHTFAPATLPSTLASSAAPAPIPALVLAPQTTIVPPTVPGLILPGSPVPRSGAPLTLAATERLDTPQGARLVGGTLPQAAYSGLLIMPATDIVQRDFPGALLGYQATVVVFGAFADIRLTIYPVADASVSFDPFVRVQGDTAIGFCRLFVPGTITALDPDGSALSATGHSPSGLNAPLIVTRVAKGVYWAAMTLTATGDWVMRFQGTVNGLALLVENAVHCRAAAF